MQLIIFHYAFLGQNCAGNQNNALVVLHKAGHISGHINEQVRQVTRRKWTSDQKSLKNSQDNTW